MNNVPLTASKGSLSEGAFWTPVVHILFAHSITLQSVIPIIDESTERRYTEFIESTKTYKGWEVLMKRLIKLMSAVLTITLLAGALVFPGAAWEYTVSPWAVAELTEAVELGLQNKEI